MPYDNLLAPSIAAVQALYQRSGGLSSAACKAVQRKGVIQLRPGMEAFQVDLRPKAGGLPLPKDIQAKMEKALGANFSDVRVHVGPEAASIGAVAFTWGANIHFAPGQYNPHTPQGQFLLGHELAHVVQQRAGRVSNPFGSGVAVVQDQALEAEADRLGQLAATGFAPCVAPSHLERSTTANSGSSVINQKPAGAFTRPASPLTRSGHPCSRNYTRI